MPRVSNIVFAARMLRPEVVAGCRVLDVGACDFNGSIRPLLESYGPAEYLGIDVLAGPCVDRVMDANDLVSEFGEESFDIVIAMEMLEHSPEWQHSVRAMKGVCKRGGLLVVTAPSHGYPYHGYPDDYWRYDLDDFRAIFSDCEIICLEHDPSGPGSQICVRKPQDFQEVDLIPIQLHSMVAGCRIESLQPEHWRSQHFRKVRMQQALARWGRQSLRGVGTKVRRLFRLSN